MWSLGYCCSKHKGRISLRVSGDNSVRNWAALAGWLSDTVTSWWAPACVRHRPSQLHAVSPLQATLHVISLLHAILPLHVISPLHATQHIISQLHAILPLHVVSPLHATQHVISPLHATLRHALNYYTFLKLCKSNIKHIFPWCISKLVWIRNRDNYFSVLIPIQSN